VLLLGERGSQGLQGLLGLLLLDERGATAWGCCCWVRGGRGRGWRCFGRGERQGVVLLQGERGGPAGGTCRGVA
jgi:hypothetical protein